MKRRFFLIFIIICTFNTIIYAINRDQAIRYAYDWVMDASDPNYVTRRNPFFYAYSGDCANYSSQCLISGGLCLLQGVVDNMHSIPSCDNLNAHLLNHQINGTNGHTRIEFDGINETPAPPNNIEEGDIIIFGTQGGDEYEHAVVVVYVSGSDIYCNAHTNDRVNRLWTFWFGSGNYEFKVAHFYHIDDNAGDRPNLRPYIPSGWDNSLVVSKQSGNHIVDTNFEPGQTVYIDFAVLNRNTAGQSNQYLRIDIPDGFYCTLFLIKPDYSEELLWDYYPTDNGIWYDYYLYGEDDSYTLPQQEGNCTFRLDIDSDGFMNWSEDNETDNTINYVFTVMSSEDDIYISSGPSQINVNSQVTYQSIFEDIDGSGSYADYWNWKIKLNHSAGTYTLASQDSVFGHNQCSWTTSIGSLPNGYNWERDSNDNITGYVQLNATDSDGYTHEEFKTITLNSYSSLPYSTGFESGFDQFWTSSSTENGQVQVTSNNGPHSGSKHVTMGVSGAIYSLNEMSLHCALSSGSEDVALEFWWKDFSDENHAQEGIYFSNNSGSTFTKVYNLLPQSYSNNYWRKFTLDVDQLAVTYGLSLSQNFVIKYQQYDNELIPSDGFAFDDISIKRTGLMKKTVSDSLFPDIAINAPEEYELLQNYPNPFNPTTTISYSLKEEADVKLVVYNMLGQEVATLADRKESAGYKSLVWCGRDNFNNPLASGVYIYRITAGNFAQVRKMILVK